jgi:predicted acylesterase/phospholipase RssA/CRP-like cAMP-binding protein
MTQDAHPFRYSLLDIAAKLDRLAVCPLLRDVPRAALAPLAQAMVQAEYPRAHFFGGDEDGPLPPLRLIVTGSVALSHSFAAEPGRRLLGPGDLFGLETVAARLFPDHERPPDRFGAHTVDPTRCLELREPDYEAVFGRDETREPLRAVLNAWSLSLCTPLAARALAQTQEMSCLRPDQILALISRASVCTLQDGERPEDVTAGAPPGSAYILLAGRLDRVSEPAGLAPSWGWIAPGQVVGLNELFDREAMGYSLRARGRTRLLRISAAAIFEVAKGVPGFLRGVVHAVGKARLLEQELTPLRSTTVAAVLAASPAIPEPLAAPVHLLARAIAADFHEDVLLVRVHASPQPCEPPTPWELNPDNAGGPGAVREVHVGVGDLTQAWLSSWLLSYWDVALIDGTELGPLASPEHPLLAALAALVVPVRLSVLLDAPARWHQVTPWLPPPLLRHALPVAALGPYRDPRSPLLAVAPEPPAPGPLPRRALRRVAAYCVALASAFTGRLRSELAPVAAHGGGEAWPVGCARLVLTRGLYGTARSEEPDQATRESLGRWARAITRRRVGLALGGGGALSFTGAAMLVGLCERSVPVDMVSGTSFGTVVAAFYAVGGAPGLRLLERAWPSLLVALSSTSFNTMSLGVWVEMHLGAATLAELATALFPVATLAENSSEWDIRGGALGAGVQSSGSLPPFAPTIAGRLRLLDGGFSADVPCRILAEEGADLVIAVNPFPPSTLRPPAGPWIPFASRLLEELNPLLRYADLLRSYQMLWRLGAQSQMSYADVVFTAEDSTITALDFHDGRTIVDRALASDALRSALDRAASRWRAMASEPQRLPTLPGERPSPAEAAP